jgi:DNA helicase-2/ATP-dependent DNA helicase PcrA
MALEPPERSIALRGSKDRDDSVLTLSTIHSAKGLEWHTVFLIYVAEGHMSSYLSFENKDALEEERRLFYVATTRAKENLFLIKPHLDRSPRSFLDEGGSVFTQVSRFLDEGDILHTLVDVEAALNIASPFDNFELDDTKESRSLREKEFFDSLEEFFSDSE